MSQMFPTIMQKYNFGSKAGYIALPHFTISRENILDKNNLRSMKFWQSFKLGGTESYVGLN